MSRLASAFTVLGVVGLLFVLWTVEWRLTIGVLSAGLAGVGLFYDFEE